MTTRRTIQLAKRIEAWQRCLPQLGLRQYKIEGVTIEEHPNGNAQAHASVIPSDYYDSAWFSFATEFVEHCYDEDDMEKLDVTIIHEWLHVAFRDYYAAIALVEDQLSPPAQEMWAKALDTPHEALVERLARQIYHAFYSDVVP